MQQAVYELLNADVSFASIERYFQHIVQSKLQNILENDKEAQLVFLYNMHALFQNYDADNRKVEK